MSTPERTSGRPRNLCSNCGQALVFLGDIFNSLDHRNKSKTQPLTKVQSVVLLHQARSAHSCCAKIGTHRKAGDNMATGRCWRCCALGCSGVALRLFSTTTFGSPDATSLCLILTRAHGERVLYVSMCTGAAMSVPECKCLSVSKCA